MIPVPQVLKKLTSKVGADLIFEASSTAESVLQMLDMVKVRDEITKFLVEKLGYEISLGD